MSRFLLEPCNNTLSHVAKCLALREALEARGHEVFLAVSAARAAFLERIGEDRYFVLPDIQEADAAPLPGFSWFRAARFETCVRAELDLLNTLRPDAVLGVFRFTGAISAALANIPYDALICGSMTPACSEILGFAADEPGASAQAAALQFFRHRCARRLQPAFSALGLAPIDDIWQLLQGRRTFLWDYPEFQPLAETPGYHHVGPVFWPHWPQPAGGTDGLDGLRGPIAFVALGTGGVPPGWLGHLIEALWLMGYAVALALGGQTIAEPLPEDPQRLAVCEFLPIELALARSDLVVCHGGQMLIFEALRQRLPVFVLPMQPEQAQNGVCVERIGCGRRLFRGVVYDGQVTDIRAAFLSRPLLQLADEMLALLDDAQTPSRLARAADQMAGYHGVAALATQMEFV